MKNPERPDFRPAGEHVGVAGINKRILFAGEIQPLWEEFQAGSTGAGRAWTAEFARTGAEALAALERTEFAAMAVDVSLRGMGGLEFLELAVQRQPRAFRVVLSDMADTRSTVKCLGRGHYHLLKPCDPSTLLKVLEQAAERDAWLPGQHVRSLISEMRRIPSPPAIYFQILAEMQSPNTQVERVADLIAHDPAIAAKILQLANSAVFGLQLQVIQPVEAVIFIGLETTRSLVLMAHTFSAFDQLQLPGFSIDALWSHSVLAGRFARQITLAEDGGPEVVEQSCAAGLLHDIGKLLLAANLPEPFRRALALAREQQRPLREAEVQVLGAGHDELGACLLGLWGLPRSIVEAVAWHHCPSRLTEPGFRPLTAVHAADALAHEAWPERAPLAPSGLDLDYLKALGLDARMETWRNHCLSQNSEMCENNDAGTGMTKPDAVSRG